MNRISQRPGPTRGGQRPQQASAKPPLPAIAIISLIVIGAAVVAYEKSQSDTPPAAPPPQISLWPKQGSAARTLDTPSDVSFTPPAPPPPRAAAVAPVESNIVPLGEPTAESRRLLAILSSLNVKGPITPDQAQRWKDALNQLIKQGSSSAAGIAEFLAKKQDLDFSGVDGADQLGYSSLRSSLIDALNQIGGPEATSAMVQTMQNAASVSELATLAKNISSASPGQYQQEILNAARSELVAAASGQAGQNPDVGPLYQILSNAGTNNVNAVADFTQFNGKWGYLSAISLASMPNGEGVPALIQMAQGAQGGNSAIAVPVLAELAPENPDALNAIVKLAKSGQLSDTTIVRLAPYLGGEQYQLTSPSDSAAANSSQGFHIASGNQNFASTGNIDNMTPTQINESISAINQLLGAVPSNDTQGRQTLEQWKNNLSNKLPR